MKLENLYNQKDELNNTVYLLNEKKNKEQKDVDRLEKGSLSSYFYELIGSIDQKLEKERKEAYESKLKYDSALYQLNSVNRDINYYENTLKELETCEVQYQQLLNEKLSFLKQTSPEIIKIENQISSSKILQNELQEALIAGNQALSTTNQIIKELNNADGWSTYDLFGGGLIADIAKYDSLDNAQDLVQQLQAELVHFRCELTDVDVEANIQISIGEFLKMADYWFDNFFTDYTVKERISNALSQINTTRHQMIRVIENIETLLEKERKNESSLKETLEKQVVES